ncbi:MAG: hypothetical protein GY696_37140 [Gammaproteobacteria bacterium]|nr:hypothetical protein [Gammaproteobacteria bacterium]
MSVIEVANMISKKQVLHMVVGLIEVSDFSLIEQGFILNNEVCAKEDVEKIKALANLIKELYSGFDYPSSVEFLSSVDGKSDSFKKMKSNMVDTPTGRQKHLAIFGEAICDIGEVSRIDVLIKPDQKGILEEARSIFSQLSNPL